MHADRCELRLPAFVRGRFATRGGPPGAWLLGKMMGTSWDTIGGILIAWDNESMMFIVIIIFIFNYYCRFFSKIGDSMEYYADIVGTINNASITG